MENRRICHIVINEMMLYIPKSEKALRKDLLWNFEDSLYKAPEETLQWQRTMETLIRHIPDPVQDWEYEILSIFTTKSIDQLKIEFKVRKDEN